LGELRRIYREKYGTPPLPRLMKEEMREEERLHESLAF